MDTREKRNMANALYRKRRRELERSITRPEHQRCPTCGGMVTMPCIKCRNERAK